MDGGSLTQNAGLDPFFRRADPLFSRATLVECQRRLLRSKAEAFAEALDAARSSIWLTEDIRGASVELVRRKEALPDYLPEPIEYDSCPPGNPITLQSWGGPAQEQIKKVRGALHWFVEVLRLAEARAQQGIRPASRRADEPLYEFLFGIEQLYEQAACNPTRPHFDPIEEVERGELLDLINACLAPLGVNMTRSALLALYRRAKESLATYRRATDRA